MTIALVAILAVAVIALAAMLLALLMPAQSAKTESALQESTQVETRGTAVTGGVVASEPEGGAADASDSGEAADVKKSGTGSTIASELPPGHNGITGAGGSSGATSSREVYLQLVSFLEGAASFDAQVADCATDFNNGYLSKSADDRTARSKRAATLKSQIKHKWDEVSKLDVPFWSSNRDSWGDICELYECLWHRIDVIDRAWAISLSHADPEGYEDEILAPIVADQEGGQNKYYLRYKELYPTIELENA